MPKLKWELTLCRKKLHRIKVRISEGLKQDKRGLKYKAEGVKDLESVSWAEMIKCEDE